MPESTFRPKAFLRVGCPFSFKFLLFMSEARLLERIEVARCDPEDPGFEEVKAKLAAGLGKSASFPTVEVEPGLYKSDSDQLIDYFADKYHVKPGDLPALTFYRESIFPQLEKLHQ